MPTIEQAHNWYRDDDPVHGFDHILRVLHVAEAIAEREGADVEIVRAAALLHDASGGDLQEDERADHHELSAQFAFKILSEEGWPKERIEAVQHCIESHRFRGGTQAASLEAKVLFDADKLDVLGAFGVARTIAYALEAKQAVYARPSEQFLMTGKKIKDEPHSAYHEYLFKLRHIINKLNTKTAREIAQGRHQVLASFFEQLALEANFTNEGE